MKEREQRFNQKQRFNNRANRHHNRFNQGNQRIRTYRAGDVISPTTNEAASHTVIPNAEQTARPRSRPVHLTPQLIKAATQQPPAVHVPISGGTATPRTATPPQRRPGGPRNNRFQRKNVRPPRRPTGAAKQLPTKKGEVVPPLATGHIRIIPLGGVEEVGRNMTIVEYENDIVIIDAGLQFGSSETPGVNYLLPNTSYLEERKDKIRALVITHGHLDHIGALPYLIERLGNPPIYTREFGGMLIKKRHEEFPHLPALDMKIIGKEDGALPVGEHLKVRFFGLTHSIPDSSGAIIETPHGDLVFTGDVRVENDAGVADPAEEAQYSIFQQRKVLFLAMDSTGIERPGWSLSEKKVIESVDRIVKDTGGRILIATFASQVERIIAFIEIAKKYNRYVAIDGRSMKSNVEIIKKLRLSEVKHAIPIEEVVDHAPNRVMILATGAQGEEFASLMRIANGTHKSVKLGRTDTIILSSSVIPGNERAVATLKDNLYRNNTKVITYLDSDVHTSGHGKRGELEWIHRHIPYTFFMPVHGNHYMLKMHAELAKNLGCPLERTIVPDNGSIIDIDPAAVKISALSIKAPASPLTVDGFAIGDMQDVVIRDRQMLAEEGMFVIVASVNASTGRLRKSPDIISRGFIYLRESQELLREVREVIKRSIENTTVGQRPIDFDTVKNVVTDEVSRFLLQRTAKRPIVIPVILGF